MAQNPIVTIKMKDGSEIRAELYPEIAPVSVNNFISLINKKFYDGLIFHRVIKGFMIQGGCPDGNGMGGPGYHIKGEFSMNGFENNLKHTEGVLSMARAMDPNSAGSQFFIMHKTSPHLDGSYAAFGKVIEGMEVVNKIAETRTDWNDRPVEPQIMETVTVDTFGTDYPNRSMHKLFFASFVLMFIFCLQIIQDFFIPKTFFGHFYRLYYEHRPMRSCTANHSLLFTK